MADILEGTSGHTSHAPLSHSQTVSMCKHLMNEIRSLQQKHEDLEKDFYHANDGQSGLRAMLDETNSDVRSLKEGLDAANSAVDALRKDGGRSTSNILKLLAGHEQTNESLAAVREAQKVNNTKLQKIEQDLTNTTGLATNLQDAIEKRVLIDISALQDELSKTNHFVNKLHEEEQSTKTNLQDERKNLRATNKDLQTLRDDLTNTNTVVHIVETRLADNTNGLKAARATLDELGSFVQKVDQDMEKAKKEVSHVQSGVKTNTANIKKNTDALDRAVTGLQGIQSRLDEAGGGLDSTRRGLETIQGRVQSLLENQEMAHRTIRNMKAELAEVASTANQVKNGLRETNSLVLPNLSMDMGATMPVSTPTGRNADKDKHIKKVSKNGGANRMAWI